MPACGLAWPVRGTANLRKQRSLRQVALFHHQCKAWCDTASGAQGNTFQRRLPIVAPSRPASGAAACRDDWAGPGHRRPYLNGSRRGDAKVPPEAGAADQSCRRPSGVKPTLGWGGLAGSQPHENPSQRSPSKGSVRLGCLSLPKELPPHRAAQRPHPAPGHSQFPAGPQRSAEGLGGGSPVYPEVSKGIGKALEARAAS